MTRLALPKNRNFWFSIALFAFVILTCVLLLLDWNETTRVEIFRRIIQMLLFTFWGFDRYSKYRSQMIEDEQVRRPGDNGSTM
jgi:hypothetical protein